MCQWEKRHVWSGKETFSLWLRWRSANKCLLRKEGNKSKKPASPPPTHTTTGIGRRRQQNGMSIVYYPTRHTCLQFLPNHQWVACKMEAQSEHVRVAYTFFARLAPTCMLSRCLITKISASELRRKLIKSALSVGYGCGGGRFLDLLPPGQTFVLHSSIFPE